MHHRIPSAATGLNIPTRWYRSRMELRLIELAMRVLDPRRWRLRLVQLGCGAVAALWIWVRAVQSSDEVRMVRDARRRTRDASIAERLAERERQHWSA